MKRTRHAAEDGSFGRSAGMAAGRGAALLAVAVFLGIVLLNAADDGGPQRVATSEEDEPSSETSTTVSTTTTPTVPMKPPAEVKVLAANGTAVKGVARKVTDQLKAAGYNVLAPTDAKDKSAATSLVFFAVGFEREAQAIAAGLGLSPGGVQALPTPLPVADIRGASVVVVVGNELAQRLSATSTTTAGGATTTTTRASSASSSTTTTRP